MKRLKTIIPSWLVWVGFWSFIFGLPHNKLLQIAGLSYFGSKIVDLVIEFMTAADRRQAFDLHSAVEWAKLRREVNEYSDHDQTAD